MSTTVSYPHIEKPDREPARLARLPRVRVAQIIMDHLAHGWSAEEICRQHPQLRPAEVHSAFGYYFDNKAAVDEEIEREWAEAEKLSKTAHTSPFSLRIQGGRRT